MNELIEKLIKAREILDSVDPPAYSAMAYEQQPIKYQIKWKCMVSTSADYQKWEPSSFDRMVAAVKKKYQDPIDVQMAIENINSGGTCDFGRFSMRADPATLRLPSWR